MVLGADPWQTFRHVTLPLLRPGLVAGDSSPFSRRSTTFPCRSSSPPRGRRPSPVAIMSYLVNQDFDPIVGAISAIRVALVLALLLVLDRVYGIAQITSFGGQ